MQTREARALDRKPQISNTIAAVSFAVVSLPADVFAVELLSCAEYGSAHFSKQTSVSGVPC
jgi:hypothetical protein